MTQYAIIKKLTGPEKAEVEVLRGTACGDDCGSCEVCHYASKIRVEARNAIGASVGDRVEIETATSRVLGAAVLVYVVPFVLFFIGYAIAALLLDMAELQAMLMSFAFFAVGFVVVAIVGKRHKKNPITYEITNIIGCGADGV
ncbi:MAG TPA: SoxR reducing system RseC family protein [Candidatus Scatomorpha pullistercoris]|uniref:SoxR reducing system RseC family protein n=1 Tax=Candidatus Scatomorpha pullistercoris TaxID=2840929 RepID=A0A9D1G4Y4_9FIRM|nr:SoxR reducing system RseC family protein [Candidatus Scatomorpha pullistercoris]